MKNAAAPSILVAVMLLAVAVIAEAQQPKKVYRIGYLSMRDQVGESSRYETMRLALRELGYIEGQNITTEYRYAEGKLDRAPELAAELVRLKVDIIVVAGGIIWIREAKNATKTIPIVMVGAGNDLVEAGLIESLDRPGGNVTGITNLARELGGKRLEILKEAAPKVNRVAVLHDPTRPDSVQDVKEILPAAARALRLTIQPLEVRTTEDFDKAFAAISKSHADALYPNSRSPVMAANEKRIVDFVLKNRLPSMYGDRRAVDIGGLMSYGADQTERYRLIAWYVDKISKGTKPADLPVQQPTKFEFVVNLKTAKQIGVTIPPEVLARANRVIK
jgi:putative tryptophan/tyrosine transport system substrate-binding protein